MEIKIPQEFTSVVENRKILLDTNVFIDVSLNPTQLTKFLNELKENDCTFFTSELVVAEFVKGAITKDKIRQKEELVGSIIESYIQLTQKTLENCIQLIKVYGEDSKSLSITDLLLGSLLLDSPEELLLITKNTTDFPTNIFKLETCFNIIHRKAIQTYGVYSYPK